ncbi:similar to Saccharomyces cerevisiae YDR477W SNF1 AMP-activated serine/threonine protein kinase found in a complex containing Snf4p and members of the Sip1p/Sip2p/Gal83p family [Maudiozyma saulgeensis]|uniref:non-specific serine/threonine protein kinase n=1 Tax=Maudiozyma saulgeensis TaxID=1789683 RepID=A0A1X7QXD4_9SACH|nr:similar to Saccharomyces cerevisiae YDR477W SNF1 AMP-activated serine/threonine protein kinase found in a complex containing Snf4p and members of the Sip1p/Sip2p/Gal83p family [Kazachstania saulgeensis]
MSGDSSRETLEQLRTVSGSPASRHKHKHHHHHHHHHRHHQNRNEQDMDMTPGRNSLMTSAPTVVGQRPPFVSAAQQARTISNRDRYVPSGKNRLMSGHHTAPVANNNYIKRPLPRLADGTRFGSYQIVKTLGTGSFGKVKLAYHITSGQKVALKIINKKILSRRDMQGRIEREISYLRLLRHPHIIKLYDVIKSNDEIIIVLEYAQHELFEYITQHGRLSEDEARHFFQEIISAVEYCHRHKVVHRDLKPENLLLDKHYRVKITDFGLSNIMTDGNFLKTSCGSPNYAAPEIIGGKLYAGPEVDVWSCGVILYVLLCHRLPFDDESLPKLFKNINNGIYALPNFLSPGAASLIKRMLIVNPLGRISIQEIMQDEWFKKDIPLYLVPQDLREDENESLNGDSDTNSLTASIRSGEENIDEELVTALANTMGYGIDEIYESLETETTDPGLLEIRDAYLLMKENKDILKDLRLVRSDSDISLINNKSGEVIDTMAAQQMTTYHRNKDSQYHLTTASGEPCDPMTGSMKQGMMKQQRTYNDTEGTPLDTNESTITILPTSLPQIHRVNMFAEGFPGAGVITPMLTPTSKTRWHFGIRSHSYPLVVMGEVYTALKRLGAQWIRTTERELWTIRVLWKWDGQMNQENVDTLNVIPERMKVVVQLFQTSPNYYLVDLKFDGWETNEATDSNGQIRREATPSAESIAKDEKVSTFSAYPFLNLSTKLINELVRENQVSTDSSQEDLTT